VYHIVTNANGNDKERNERVIHTRVPETLEAELKQQAAEMGISVSNLVRNVLSHALGLVNDIVHDSEQIVKSARDSIEAGVRAVRGKPGVAGEPTLLGWQQAVLERNAICGHCNDILPRGSDAAVGVFDAHSPSVRPVICLRCLEEIRDERKPAPPDRS
jgi:hypothetical protein